MNILGVIAEFNPFHNGHHYFLKTAREATRADFTIVVMSGDFTQRGEPAIYDKFHRTQWALSCGADAVIELPVTAATASAKDFAMTGVSLLAATGIVTHLAFGCEHAQPDKLMQLSRLIADEPDIYKNALKQSLKSGQSWPAARTKALQSLAGDESARLLSQPNNILAIEYLSALRRTSAAITPLAVQRQSVGYHEECLDKALCSATALRQALHAQLPDKDYFRHFPPEIQPQIAGLRKHTPAMTLNDFSAPLIYKLLSENSADTLSKYLDIDTFLAQRILNHLENYTDYQHFIEQISHRAYTRTRIQRVLLHILLNLKEEHRQALQNEHYCPYIRLLGFRRSGTDVLSALKDHCRIPVITRPAAGNQCITSPAGQKLWQADAFASQIYRTTCGMKSGTAAGHEYRQKLIII